MLCHSKKTDHTKIVRMLKCLNDNDEYSADLKQRPTPSVMDPHKLPEFKTLNVLKFKSWSVLPNLQKICQIN